MRRKAEQEDGGKEEVGKESQRPVTPGDLSWRNSRFARLPLNSCHIFLCRKACQNMMKDWHEWLWHDIRHRQLETHSPVTDTLPLGVNCCNLCYASERGEEKAPRYRAIALMTEVSCLNKSIWLWRNGEMRRWFFLNPVKACSWLLPRRLRALPHSGDESTSCNRDNIWKEENGALIMSMRVHFICVSPNAGAEWHAWLDSGGSTRKVRRRFSWELSLRTNSLAHVERGVCLHPS